HGERARRLQREQRESRDATHRCEVARIDRERPSPEGSRARPAAAEVDVLDQGVGGEKQRADPRADGRGVVAGAHQDAAVDGGPAVSREPGEPAPYPGVLAQVSEAAHAGPATPASTSPSRGNSSTADVPPRPRCGRIPRAARAAWGKAFA